MHIIMCHKCIHFKTETVVSIVGHILPCGLAVVPSCLTSYIQNSLLNWCVYNSVCIELKGFTVTFDCQTRHSAETTQDGVFYFHYFFLCTDVRNCILVVEVLNTW